MRLTELSTMDSKSKNWLVVTLLIWLAMSGWEIYSWVIKGSIVGIAYIPFFLALIIWRCAFQYEVVLDADKISVTMTGLGYFYQWQATTAETRMLMPVRKRMLLRELGVSRYSHMYSSLDSNPMRVLLVQREGKKNPHALLFKASDDYYTKFAQYLKQQNPELIIRNMENTK